MLGIGRQLSLFVTVHVLVFYQKVHKRPLQSQNFLAKPFSFPYTKFITTKEMRFCG